MFEVGGSSLATYGAIVASVALGWRIYDIWRDRSRISVKVIYAFSDVFIEHPDKRRISISAINKGRRPLTLSGAGLRLSNKIDLGYVPGREDFPYQLNEGQSHDIFFIESSLKEGIADNLKKEPRLKIEFAWFRDQTGHIHKGKVPDNIKADLFLNT